MNGSETFNPSLYWDAIGYPIQKSNLKAGERPYKKGRIEKPKQKKRQGQKNEGMKIKEAKPLSAKATTALEAMVLQLRPKNTM